MSQISENLDLLEDKIAFTFIENISNKTFKSVTKSGIILSEKAENQVGKARWGRVEAVGPKVIDVKEGNFALIEPLRWTTGLELDEIQSEFWITDEKSVLAVSEEFPE